MEIDLKRRLSPTQQNFEETDSNEDFSDPTSKLLSVMSPTAKKR